MEPTSKPAKREIDGNKVGWLSIGAIISGLIGLGCAAPILVDMFFGMPDDETPVEVRIQYDSPVALIAFILCFFFWQAVYFEVKGRPGLRQVLRTVSKQAAVLGVVLLPFVNSYLFAYWPPYILLRSKLSGMYWNPYINLENVDFRGHILAGSSFEMTEMESTDFQGVDLTKSMFDCARLSHADFRGAKLGGTTLEICHLNGANFSGTDLSGATFHFDNLCGANFSSAKGLADAIPLLHHMSQIPLSDTGNPDDEPPSTYDGSTIWPKGFDPKKYKLKFDPDGADL